jgi:hypothetical protein
MHRKNTCKCHQRCHDLFSVTTSLKYKCNKCKEGGCKFIRKQKDYFTGLALQEG